MYECCSVKAIVYNKLQHPNLGSLSWDKYCSINGNYILCSKILCCKRVCSTVGVI